MTEPTPRFWETFFEVFDGLPRQGPGDRGCAERALRMCGELPPSPAILDLGCGSGGCLAFTDAVWRKADPPPEVKASFDLDYPTMGSVADDLAAIERCGFSLVGHFTLPDEAWWRDFYTPMERRIRELRGRYASDPEVQRVLDTLAREPEMHRHHSEYYAYEFFVARRAQ